MLMPEAAVNEDGLASPSKHDIRIPGDIACMKSVSIT